jgi:hypothetical protein
MLQIIRDTLPETTSFHSFDLLSPDGESTVMEAADRPKRAGRNIGQQIDGCAGRARDLKFVASLLNTTLL